jgi:hypothetical protein
MHEGDLRFVRSRFPITNDLLSGYSLSFIDWLNFKSMRNVFDVCECKSPSDVKRVYRVMWTFVATTMGELAQS